jgi:excisionase family DNA binding protein
MGEEFIPLDEAAQRSGLHVNTLRRLLREGALRGYKTREQGKQHWMVSASSLKQYTDPFHGFLLELPGPKLYLRRRQDEGGKDEQEK